jgi:hypothetical protein
MKPITEAQFTAKLKDAFEALSCKFITLHSNMFSGAGNPDRILISPLHVCLLEIKIDDNRLTTRQKYVLRNIIRCNASAAYVVRFNNESQEITVYCEELNKVYKFPHKNFITTAAAIILITWRHNQQIFVSSDVKVRRDKYLQMLERYWAPENK